MAESGKRFDFDVLVVGGGPAGCAGAIRLAQSGARVLLCEAQLYPHDKLCGEFLSPECVPLLEGVGAWSHVRPLAPALIDVACLTAPAGDDWETRLPAPAWGLTRRALDAALAQRAREAGVDLRQGVTVTGITGSLSSGFQVEWTAHKAARAGAAEAVVDADSQVRGRQTVMARAVIAAHGKRAALDRALGRRFLGQAQPFIALKRHFRGPLLPGRIELHSFPGGYCGMSALEGAAGGEAGAANVCLLAHASAWRRAGVIGPDRAQAFVDWMRTQNPRLERWLSRAVPVGDRWLSIAQVPFGPKRAIVNDVLMAGDAAGLVAPLAGDGIAMALRGGQMAAEHLLPFVEGKRAPADLTGGYTRAWRREFNPRLRVGRFAQALMLRPRVFGLALRLINAAPALGAYFVNHTRDLRAVKET